MTVEANIAAARERMRRAAERAGRDPDRTQLVGVTKGASLVAVQAAIRAGLHDLGENVVQDASRRREELAEAGAKVRWHLIGHLQTNKVRAALGLFDIIESVDSLRLAESLDRRTARKLPILLEVNVGQETSKFGFAPDEVSAAVSAVARLANLDLVGLMTVAPATTDPETVRPVFRTLRELAAANGLEELSMGMTDDFEVAIEEGATLVRLGRAIFGERPA
jgi:pyridoxal phosphate enzyme (YggS family)